MLAPVICLPFTTPHDTAHVQPKLRARRPSARPPILCPPARPACRCYVEAMGSEEGKRRFNAVPRPSDLQRLFEVSPLAHVHRVRAPMAFMLGAKDRRVPPADAQQYVAALRAQVRGDGLPRTLHAGRRRRLPLPRRPGPTATPAPPVGKDTGLTVTAFCVLLPTVLMS